MRPPTTREGAPDRAGNRQSWTLIAVCGATFMLLVDVTIVQVALPTIQRQLHGTFSDLQWVIDAYALSLATLILTWGSASDRFGRKRVFVLGLCLFTLASLLCGLAVNATFLIWARTVQGWAEPPCSRRGSPSSDRSSADRRGAAPSPPGAPPSAEPSPWDRSWAVL